MFECLCCVCVCVCVSRENGIWYWFCVRNRNASTFHSCHIMAWTMKYRKYFHFWRVYTISDGTHRAGCNFFVERIECENLKIKHYSHAHIGSCIGTLAIFTCILCSLFWIFTSVCVCVSVSASFSAARLFSSHQFEWDSRARAHSHTYTCIFHPTRTLSRKIHNFAIWRQATEAQKFYCVVLFSALVRIFLWIAVFHFSPTNCTEHQI